MKSQNCTQRREKYISSLHLHIEQIIFIIVKLHGCLEDRSNQGRVLHVYVWRNAMVVC